VKNAGDPDKLSIVVELTPRVRKDHPGWTDANLTPGAQFRFSGWLMFDPDRPSQLYDPANPNKKNYRFHDLRHTYGTLLRRSGRTFSDIAAIMGISEPMSHVYAHEDTERIQIEAAQLGTNTAIYRLTEGA
jgi:integrase